MLDAITDAITLLHPTLDAITDAITLLHPTLDAITDAITLLHPTLDAMTDAITLLHPTLDAMTDAITLLHPTLDAITDAITLLHPTLDAIIGRRLTPLPPVGAVARRFRTQILAGGALEPQAARRRLDCAPDCAVECCRAGCRALYREFHILLLLLLAQEYNLFTFGTALINAVRTMLISFKKERAHADGDTGLGASHRGARRLCRRIETSAQTRGWRRARGASVHCPKCGIRARWSSNGGRDVTDSMASRN
jgi:hypothetical protein